MSDIAPVTSPHTSQDEQLRTLASLVVERAQWLMRNGVTFGGKRDFYDVFGYKDQLNVADYRLRYERGGIAGRIVDAMPKATWRGGVELIEDETTSEASTEFERQVVALFDRLDVVSQLQSLDILSRLSTYAVMVIGAEGDVETPLPMSTNGPDGVLYLSLYSGSIGKINSKRRTFSDAVQGVMLADAIVEKLDENPASPRFGQPVGYRLRRTDFEDPNALSAKVVHWSRVIHVAENCLEDKVYGRPALERPWNLLDDLDKVTGGGAEAFYQRANQGRLWNISKDVTNLTPDELAGFAEQIEKFQHSMTRDVRARGVEVETLGSDVAKFASEADAIITQIAGTTEIPKRILTGSEQGELASSQDRDNFRDQVNGRRNQYAWPNILRRFVNRLIEYKYLPEPKQYSARWGAVLNLTEEERLSKTKGLAEANRAQKDAGLPPIFLTRELRDLCYEREPYKPEDLEAERDMMPEPVAAFAPGDEDAPPQLRAAEEALVEQLTTAIEKKDADGIAQLLGVTSGA